MHRYSFIFILLLILCLGQVSALTTTVKSTYNVKETMIIKVSGNVVQPIDPGQVIFKRNNIFVPLEYDVARVGENWYVWAIAPQTSANYTFILQNIVTGSGSGVTTETYQKNFSVNAQNTPYNVKPGFVVTAGEFSVMIEVFSEGIETLSTNFPFLQEFSVQQGINNLIFPTEGKNSGFYNVEIGTYTLPAYLTTSSSAPQNQTQNQTTNQSNSTNTTTQNQTNQPVINNTVTNMTTNNTSITITNTTTQNQTNQTVINNTVTVEQQIFDIEPSYVQRLMYKEALSSTYSFSVYNPSSINYRDVKIIYNGTLFDIEDDEFNLRANSTYNFNITLGKYPGHDLRELIYLNTTNITVEIPFFVRYTNNASDLVTFYGEYERNSTTNVTKRKTAYYCTELGGAVCTTGATCRGEKLDSREGSCCLGICEQPDGGGSIWGWIIGIAVVAVLIWIYVKYKKASPNLDVSGISP